MKGKNDQLNSRMKKFYEEIPKYKLIRRTPVIIRVDGRAFHTFTKGLEKPFDEIVTESMQETMKLLCQNIQGCVLGYTQSDEISLLLVDYEKLESDAWYDNEVQKMCSVTASMATLYFNRAMNTSVSRHAEYELDSEYLKLYSKALDIGATFDARVFNIPKEEVANYFYWRQLDAVRNSIQALGQAHFSQKELQGKGRQAICKMLEERGIYWESLPLDLQRGSCAVKKQYALDRNGKELIRNTSEVVTWRNRWIVDKEIPIFTNEGREYIEKFVYVGA